MSMVLASTFSVALLLANGSAEVQASLVGAWEGCRSEFGTFVEHFYIEFNGDGRFRRVALRDDPERPVAEDQGRYEASGDVLTLHYTADVGGVLAEQSEAVPFQLAADILHWGAEPAIALARAQELGNELLGSWGHRQFCRWDAGRGRGLPGGWDL